MSGGAPGLRRVGRRTRYAARLARSIDGRALTLHKARTMLAVIGVASAVALVLAIPAVSTSMVASLDDVVSATASRANLEVRPTAEVGMPADILDAVRSVPGVTAAGATVERETKLRLGSRTERARLLGVEAGLLQLRPQTAAAAPIAVDDPFGAFVPEALARRLGIRSGVEIEISTPGGWRRVGVGGIVPADAGMPGRIVGIGLGVAQELYRMPGRIDAVYVQARQPERTLAALSRAVGDRALVGPVAIRAREIRQFQALLEASLTNGSLAALIAGALLVYNTMSMAAAERTQEAAVLRAVGAGRRQVVGLFLLEGLAVGVVGTLLGLAGGVALARVLVAVRGPAFENILQITITRLVIGRRDLVVAAAGGICASVVATMLPARSLARVAPASMLGPRGALEDPAPPRRRTASAGVVLMAAGIAMAFAFVATSGFVYATAAMVLLITGLVTLLPWIVPAAARTIAGRLRSPRLGLVRLGVGEVARAPRRSGYTAGALVVALAFVVASGIPISSFAHTQRTRLEQMFPADLNVSADVFPGLGTDFTLDGALTQELRQIPGVAVAYGGRGAIGSIGGRVAVITAADWAEQARLPTHSARTRAESLDVAGRLGTSDAAFVSPSLLKQLHTRVGADLPLPTPTGVRRIRIVGVYPVPTDIVPALYMDLDTFARLWGSRDVTVIGVGVASSSDPTDVRREILRRLGSRLDITVDTREQFVAKVDQTAREALAAFSILTTAGAILALVTLVNTLLLSTLARTRELGVLRAVGFLRREIAAVVTLEALTIGVVGVVLAWVLGTAIGYVGFVGLQHQVGVPIRLSATPTVYAIVLLLGLAGSVLASLYPARRAARIDVVDALQHE